MKKFAKIVLMLLAIVVVVIALGVMYVKWMLPNVGPAPDMQVEQSPSAIERGDYLANHVMVCIDCHSLRDWEKFSGPIIPGTEGGGGERFGRDMGMPGEMMSLNITPVGIGDWTDGELFRLITTGVTRDKKAIFPIMPYLEYGKLDESDIKDIIAFLRSLPPVEGTYPERELDFPVSLLVNTMPQKAALTTRPSPADRLAYGEYLTTASACKECHTAASGGKITGEYLAGGFEYAFPDGSVLRSVNITPHATGIGFWNEDFFINRFKAYTDSAYVYEPVKPGEFQTIMPWIMYGGMSEEDLGAIYTYLRSVPPVENLVERFTFASNQ